MPLQSHESGKKPVVIGPVMIYAKKKSGNLSVTFPKDDKCLPRATEHT